jgi:hypothetical protein
MKKWITTRWGKVLTGLAASLALALLWYWPLGGGERFIASLEAKAKEHTEWAARYGAPGVSVRFQRRPLARIAILSGPASEFQREGTSADPNIHREVDYPGINDRIRSIPGVAALRWEN